MMGAMVTLAVTMFYSVPSFYSFPGSCLGMTCLGGSCLLNPWRLDEPIPLKMKCKCHQIPRGRASNALHNDSDIPTAAYEAGPLSQSNGGSASLAFLDPPYEMTILCAAKNASMEHESVRCKKVELGRGGLKQKRRLLAQPPPFSQPYHRYSLPRP